MMTVSFKPQLLSVTNSANIYKNVGIILMLVSHPVKFMTDFLSNVVIHVRNSVTLKCIALALLSHRVENAGIITKRMLVATSSYPASAVSGTA